MADERIRRTRIDHLPAEELTRVLGQLGHEVGTPLGSILMIAEMLTDSCGGSAVQRHARSLQQAAKEIRDMVQAFVRLVRLRSGWFSPDASEIGGPALVRTLRDAAESVGVEVPVADDLPGSLRLDVDYLREAIELCCAWALERANQATLRIGFDAADCGRFELRWEGSQIPWDEPAILDPLGSGDMVPARRHSGSALKLPIAWMLTWRLGGRLTGRFEEAFGEHVLTLTLPSDSADPLA